MDQFHKLILSGILKSAPFCFSEKITLSKKSTQMYASVACILRVKCDQHTRCNYPNFVNNPFDLINFLNGNNLEILFIRRTNRINDKWSGHIAFPGGQLDLNESDFDAVVREVKEEIGLDIFNNSLFYWLGRLPCQNLRKKGKPLIVIPHVFIQLSLIDEELTINREEVSAAWWVKVDIFSKIVCMSDSLSISHNTTCNSKIYIPKSITSEDDQINSGFKKNYLTIDISHFVIRAIGKSVLQKLVTVFFLFACASDSWIISLHFCSFAPPHPSTVETWPGQNESSFDDARLSQGSCSTSGHVQA